MALNWKEIDLILSELDLAGSMVRQIHGPDYKSIVLDLYANREGSPKAYKVFLSVANPHCRMHRLTRKLENPSRPQRFITFLRAHIKGGRILSADQIDGERIIKLEIRKGEQDYLLWIRLWANAANILLTDTENRILDALYRRPKRNEISGRLFTPEAGGKLGGKLNHGNQDRYSIRELPGSGDFNEKIEKHFSDIEEKSERQQLKRNIMRALESQENSILLKIEQLEERIKEYAEAERWREQGDLIKGSLHKISQGDKWLKTQDFYNRNRPVEIELDPRLSAMQNAENFYKKYRRAKRNADKIEQDKTSLLSNLEEIKKKKSRIDNEEDINILRILGKSNQKKKTEKVRTPGITFESNRFRIIVGRTSRDNASLLRHYVNGNDYWFHCRDYPGAYVFVKPHSKSTSAKGGVSVPLDTMLDAANLALFYSKAKNSGQGDVYYTQVKYLRRAKGGKPGLVIPTSEKNLFVYLDPKRLERLQKERS